MACNDERESKSDLGNFSVLFHFNTAFYILHPLRKSTKIIINTVEINRYAITFAIRTNPKSRCVNHLVTDVYEATYGFYYVVVIKSAPEAIRVI